MFEYRPSKRVKKPLYGVAVNDAEYVTAYKDSEGKMQKCPYFAKWEAMLVRVYDKKTQQKRPHYVGCSVDPSWLRFSTFRAWMMQQNWEGKHLDKDLLIQGNKVYGPNTCVFVSAELNNLMTMSEATRGDLPVGVGTQKVNGHEYFIAQCSMYGKQKRLGYFKTAEEAYAKYKETKLAYIAELADAQTDARLATALRAITLP